MRGRLPGPATLELNLQGEAQERPYRDDDRENADGAERRVDGDRSDDVGGDEKLESEENGTAMPCRYLRTSPRTYRHAAPALRA